MSISFTMKPSAHRRAAVLGWVVAIGPLVSPAAGTELQSSYVCIDDVEEPPVQSFVVPQGISELQVVVQGAHGGNPDDGGAGGSGGLVQATFAVTPNGPLRPGQALDVWVGCYGDNAVGYGYGGNKGTASASNAADGAAGGGGSAIFDHVSQATLLVAGGGGGGGGDGVPGGSGGGNGGDGGADPQPGQAAGGSGGGAGGCANCQPPGEANGLDGGHSSQSGGGGGGGGGYTGGGGGEGGDSSDSDAGNGGGGGGAGSSYVASSATSVAQFTSQLAQDGLVLFDWGGDPRDRDGDGIPRSFDRCRSSETSKTVILGRCDSRAGNDLDVDGCTITDRIVRIAKRTDTRSEFLQRVRKLGRALYENDFVTRPERRAIQRCAASVNFAKLRR